MDEKVWGIYKNYIEKVLNILYTKLKRHNIDLKFKSSRELHDFLPSDKKMLGLQQIEGRENYNGHCQMWCFLIADLIKGKIEVKTYYQFQWQKCKFTNDLILFSILTNPFTKPDWWKDLLLGANLCVLAP